MSSNNSKNILFFIICIATIIYFTYRSEKQTTFLKNNYSFTAGKTLKYEYDDGFKDCIEYKYFVDSVKYIGCVINDSNISSPLSKFYKVKYSKENPESSELYLTSELTDSTEISKLGFLKKWRRRGLDNLHPN
ncbi:MAG: hypothetical protein ABI576_18910 [Flavobacterium sp.]